MIEYQLWQLDKNTTYFILRSAWLGGRLELERMSWPNWDNPGSLTSFMSSMSSIQVGFHISEIREGGGWGKVDKLYSDAFIISEEWRVEVSLCEKLRFFYKEFQHFFHDTLIKLFTFFMEINNRVTESKRSNCWKFSFNSETFIWIILNRKFWCWVICIKLIINLLP